MGAAKDMWMDAVEDVTEGFGFDRLTRDEALKALARLGFDRGEAENMLDEAVA